jgi:hypothetical protein
MKRRVIYDGIAIGVRGASVAVAVLSVILAALITVALLT